MKHSILNTLKVCLFLGMTLSASQIHAASLLLDFGATTVASTEATLDMGHFAGAVTNTEIEWNKIVNADATSGLVFSDGSAAAGVSVTVGRSDAGVMDAINFNNKVISSSALGGQLKNGIYTNTSPTKDGIFATGTSTVATNVLGVRIDGLAAGAYTLYLSGRNTSTANTVMEQFFAMNGPASSSFSFSSNTTPNAIELNSAAPVGTAPNAALAITGTFAYGDNCILLTVTLNAGDSIYLAATGITNECRGFLNAVEIVPGPPVLANFPTTIGVQPKGTSAYEGATVTIGGAQFGGVPPLYYQWYFEGNPIADATNTTLTLSNVTAGATGNYTVSVSNQVAVAVSSNAVLTIIPQFNTAQMTNIWNLLPGDRSYITANNNNNYERGLAYDPVTGDLLLVSQSPSNNVVVLNATNGAEKYFMNLSGITGDGAAAINTVGVADDGVVYVANVTANASGNSYMINRWSDDGADTYPELVFAGDPGYSGPYGLRWGDNIAVRGAGLDTEILTAPGANTNIVCLFTTDGSGYLYPNIITVTNVPSTNALAQFGIAFGPGNNTFWAKTLNQQLYLVQFDLASGMGGVIYSAPSEVVPNGFRFISTDSNQNWLAGVMTVNSSLADNVRLYDISAYTNNPVLADQELYATANHSGFLYGEGTGATIFGGNYLFALDSNNGIKAFLINTNTVLPPFSITSVIPQPESKIVLTWQSVAGHTYQIQSRTDLATGSWTDVGPAVSATGTTTSVTNSVSESAQFYRIQGQ